jgi:hypothetical protein
MMPKSFGAGNSCQYLSWSPSAAYVVGGEGEAGDVHQQCVIRQRGGVGPLRFDRFALLQIIAGDDEVGGLHVLGPRFGAP